MMSLIPLVWFPGEHWSSQIHLCTLGDKDFISANTVSNLSMNNSLEDLCIHYYCNYKINSNTKYRVMSMTFLMENHGEPKTQVVIYGILYKELFPQIHQINKA